MTGRGALRPRRGRKGFGIDIALQAKAAQLLDRDDIKAQVTGPIAIRSDGEDGSISGKVDLVSGSFRLGSATAAAQVPRLAVREINRPADERPAPRRLSPWRLDLDVDAPRPADGHRPRHQQRVERRPQDRRHRHRAADQRPRRSHPRQLRFRRPPLRPRARPDPLPRRIPGQSGARHHRRGRRARASTPSIRVTGRGQRPEIAFTSTPALPQDELLSRLLFGTSITNLSAPEALQLAAAVASLNNSGGGLDPINAVRAATGLDRLRIVPADITTGQGTADRRRQISRPPGLCRGGDRRPRLFGDARRISDHPLALAPVEHLDDRPGERQRQGVEGLLRWSDELIHVYNYSAVGSISLTRRA